MPIDTRLPQWMVEKNFTTSNSVSHDLHAGAQLAQQQQQINQRNRELVMRQAAEKLKYDMMRQQAEGSVALGIIMEQATQKNTWTAPETRSKVYGLARQYPWLAETDLFKGAMQNFEHADMAQKQLDQILLRHSLDAVAPEPRTADVKNISQLAEWKSEMRELVEAGEFDAAEDLRQRILQLETQLTPSNTTVESFGPEGQVISRITTGKGGAAAAPELTMAVRSDLQKRLIASEKAADMSKQLAMTLTPLNVGIAGWGQQVMVDEGIGQLFPGLVSQQNVDARTLLGAYVETMIKNFKVDAQMNAKEEQRIKRFLPKTGANESIQSATSKILRVMRELHNMREVDSKRLGTDEPAFPLSAEEIKTLWKSGKLTDRELAKDLLNTYYPEVLTPYQ